MLLNVRAQFKYVMALRHVIVLVTCICDN